MLVHESYVDLSVEGCKGPMRVHVFKPTVTGPVQRLCRLLAGKGYIAASCESYHEYEPAGTILPYDVPGTDRGNALKIEKSVQGYDNDAAAVAQYLLGRPDCNGRLGSVGMCLGGHLAFRAALLQACIAAVCLFPTDIHKSSLGKGGDDTLQRMSELADNRTELCMVFGKQDGHVPPDGRAVIHTAMSNAKVDFSWCELNARHAFIRDELSKGRYDPALTAVVHGLMFELLDRRLLLGMPSTAAVEPQTSSPGPAEC